MRLGPPRQLPIVLLCLAATLVGRPAQAQVDPAGIVAGQELESTGLAVRWLLSLDLRVRAWGAYLASKVTYRPDVPEDRELVRELVALVQDYHVPPQPLSSASLDEHDAMAGVLDALIQIGFIGHVPRSTAVALYPEFPAQAIMVLAHGQGLVDPPTSFAWDLVRRDVTGTEAWLGAVNLLEAAQAPGLAGFLLAGLTIDARLTVVDERPLPRKGGGLSCSGVGTPSPRPGWPPVGNYHLNAGFRGALVINGVDPVFYTRSVGRPDFGQPAEEFCSRLGFDRNRFLVRLLANLAGESPDRPSVNWTTADTVTWRGSASFVSDLKEFIRTQEASVASLIAKLAAAGQLTPDEAKAARPAMELRIDDLRGQQTTALPELTGLPGNVRIVK